MSEFVHKLLAFLDFYREVVCLYIVFLEFYETFRRKLSRRPVSLSTLSRLILIHNV